MKTNFVLVGVLHLCLVASAADPTTIETVRGKVYRQCRILKHEPDGVSFAHSQGVAKVLFAEIREPLRTELGYDVKKADAFERERVEARKAAETARRERETKLAEAMIQAQARWRAQQPLVMMPPAYGYNGLNSLAPVLGLGGIGVPYGYHGHHVRSSYQTGGWSSVGNASIGAGTGGIYVPQSGGLIFNNIPGVQYSPTLGYTNSLINNSGPSFFGMQHSGVVPGVSVQGGISMPGHR